MLKHDDSLWGWGNNGSSVLGNDSTRESLTPVKIMDDVSMISAYMGYAMVIKRDGSLWLAGANMPSLSTNILAGNANKRVFNQIMKDESFKYASATRYGAFVINDDNELWGWGGERYWDQMFANDQDEPGMIMSGVNHASAGVRHLIAAKTDGTLWNGGENYNGGIL